MVGMSIVPYLLWNFSNTFSAALNSSIDFANLYLAHAVLSVSISVFICLFRLIKAPEGAPFGLEFESVNLCHSENDSDEVTFVCVPVGGGDSAFLCELSASGDELFVFGDGVD